MKVNPKSNYCSLFKEPHRNRHYTLQAYTSTQFMEGMATVVGLLPAVALGQLNAKATPTHVHLINRAETANFSNNEHLKYSFAANVAVRNETELP